MKRNFSLMAFLVFTLLGVCANNTVHAQARPIKTLQNADTLITSDVTWDCDTVYFMKGKIYVTSGAELTIQPGTVIIGDTINKGSLIITKGSKIHAVGTPSCPIIFTSSKKPGNRKRGDWGGVIILGNAKINPAAGVAYIEGITPSPLTEYGGTNDNDNSGELNYVRIEFPGVALSPNNEINGLTMGGVGSGTSIDYVQVSYANDDSFEWFGGTVNAKHLIAYRGIDDDFDTDFGFSGKVQFGISLRDPAVADVSGSNGFESDNDATGSSNLPQTRAIFSNMSLSAGADTTANSLYRQGVLIRRNSHLYLYNSIIIGFPQGINIDGSGTQTNVTNDTMVQNNLVTCKYAPKYVVTTSPSANATVISLLQTNAANSFYADNLTGPNLKKPFSLTKPDFRPLTGSPALSGGNFSYAGLNDPFFTNTNFRGAMGKKASDNWATVWTNFTPTAGTSDYGAAPCDCSLSAAKFSPTVSDDAVDVKISPNPVRGQFYADIKGFNGTVNIKVTNMNGTAVYSAKQNVAGKANIKINLNVNEGIYFVNVTDGTKNITKTIKVVK